MNSDELQQVITLIQNEDLGELKKFMGSALDWHYSSDYLLYVAVFHRALSVQHFLIEQGLDPDVTKGRLKHAHPHELQYLKEYKKIIEEKKQLELELKSAAEHSKTVKV